MSLNTSNFYGLRDLKDFVTPINSDVSALCEVDNRTYFAEGPHQVINDLTTTVNNHPAIQITSELLRPATLRDDGRSLFLPVDVPFLKQLTQAYHERGCVEVLRTASRHRSNAISKPAKALLMIAQVCNKVSSVFNPSLQYESVTTIDEYSQTRGWHNQIVRCIEWHPHTSMVAVCSIDDCVRVYIALKQAVFLLKCKEQKNVTCLAWRPLMRGELAVGHEGGIVIWNIDPNSLVTRPSVSNAVILHRINHRPIINLTWSPKGNFLVSCAACDRSVYVWCVEIKETSRLKKAGGSGNVIVKWSPTGDRLFTASNKIVFRIWDCRNWNSEKWTVLSGHVQAACWTRSGNHLLFATSTESVIYGLTVKSQVVFATDVEKSDDNAIPLFDLSVIEKNGIRLGGLVQTMEIDPKGNNLAVLFKNTNAVLVFSIAEKRKVHLMASSIIINHNEVPTSISFQKNFEAGACLSIGWSNGKIQHFPITYTDLYYNSTVISNSFNQSNAFQSFCSF